MSDLTIPGVTSKYNTDKLIEGTMQLERIQLERMQEDIENQQEEKKIWQGLNMRLSSLRDSSRKLYGFENPFQERIAVSGNEDALTATATREALEEERRIEILQEATGDSFISSSLPKDFEAPEGRYSFLVGEKSISFNFRGGAVKDLAAIINRKGGNYLQAKVVNNTSTTQVIVVEGIKTGADNLLVFEDTALEFGIRSGIIEESNNSTWTPGLSNLAEPWTTDLNDGSITADDTRITIQPDTEFKLPLNPPYALSDELYLEFTIQVTNLPEDAWQAPETPPGPDIPSAGSVSLSGITVRNAASENPLPPWESPQPPEKVEDMQVLFGSGRNRDYTFAPITDTQDEQVIRIPLSAYKDLQSLNIRNRNTYKEITISDLKIYNPEERSGYQAVNPLTTAGDARLKIDGIEVVRSSNTIDDLIAGVTLEIKEPTERPFTLNIEADRELIKEDIIQFVFDYNKLIEEVLILTSRDEAVVDELTYLEDDEREKVREKLGWFQGDMTLVQLKNSLQTRMQNPYQTDMGRELSLLAQIGISTNSAGYGGGFNASKMRGYMEANEDDLDTALATNLDEIKQLFGNDSDGDLLVDTGVGFMINNYVDTYTRTGGIISTKLDGLDRSIDDTNERIAREEIRLEDYEAELKQKYGTMEGMVESLQQQSGALDGLNNNNQ